MGRNAMTVSQVRDVLNSGLLEQGKACDPAMAWLDRFAGAVPAHTAWKACNNVDWMRWLIIDAALKLKPARFRGLRAELAGYIFRKIDFSDVQMQQHRGAVQDALLAAIGSGLSLDERYGAYTGATAASTLSLSSSRLVYPLRLLICISDYGDDRDIVSDIKMALYELSHADGGDFPVGTFSELPNIIRRNIPWNVLEPKLMKLWRETITCNPTSATIL